MLNAKVKFLLVVGCFVILGTWLVGCNGGKSGPPTEPVSGTVTLDGKPLAQASVVFAPAGTGQPAVGVTDEAGKYTLTTTNPKDGAVVGSYKITVIKASASGPVANLDLSKLSPAEADKAARKAFNESGGAKKAVFKKGRCGRQ